MTAYLRRDEVLAALEDVEWIARLWLEHQGYDTSQIEELIAPVNHDQKCQFISEQGWDCLNPEGISYHPEHDTVREGAELMVFVAEKIIGSFESLSTVELPEAQECPHIRTRETTKYGAPWTELNNFCPKCGQSLKEDA